MTVSEATRSSEIKKGSRERDNLVKTSEAWTKNQKILFRIAFIFFFIMSVPTDWKWVERLFAINVFDMNYRDLYEAANYSPGFVKISSESGRWGIASYANWGVVLLFAIVAGAVWTLLVKNREPGNYNKLYYWLRVIVRYRIAIGVIAFGYVKVFPTQMPYPSVTILNTEFIDFLEQKLYWYHVGIIPWYQVFLGVAEVFAGALLFYRRTTALGAFLTACILLNIVWANHAYDGGVHVYSAYFVLLSSFILVYDFRGIWNLVVKERDVVPVHYYPVFTKNWQQYFAYSSKYFIMFLFIVLFFYIRYVNYFHETNPIKKEPTTPGLAGAQGLYNVIEFKVNNKALPYNPNDSVRWQSAVFEKWSTFTFKVNRPVQADLGNGGPEKKDIDKNFEVSGIGGGQRFFYYDADTVNRTLYLQDKNVVIPGKANGTPPKKEEKEKYRTKLTLHYSRPSASRIILTGLSENKDSLYVVLDRVEKYYPLNEDRRFF